MPGTAARYSRTATEGVVPVADALRDLVAASMGKPAVVVVSRSALSLQPFWPDLRLVAGPRGVAMAAAGRWPGRAAVTFGPGILRAPSRHVASSTIVATQRSGTAAGSLGLRYLSRLTPADVARGTALAAEIQRLQLGGDDDGAAALPAAIRLVVACGTARQDHARVSALLDAGSAASIVLLNGSRRLRQSVARAGGRCIDRAGWRLVEAAAEIHADADSEIGVLAALAGRAVVTDGDGHAAAEPGRVAAAYLVLGTRYRDPADGRPLTAEAFLDRLAEWRRLRRRLPAIACVAGISFWKKRRIADFLGAEPVFASNARQAVDAARRLGGGIAVWPSRAPAGLDQAASAAGVPVFRIEDGFVRSRGLGADFIPPASVIVDRRGIYYDTRTPSDLEHLLLTAEMPAELLARAHRLRQDLVRRGITKYGSGGAAVSLPSRPGARRILVPGQVADDQSVLAGGGGLSPGVALLERVRAAHPDAFIVYKPHPDVEAGHRPGAVPDGKALRHADLVLRDVPMAALIDAVDEVHTLTSLAGFEALLRGRRVVTYGRPFYAGWGLTIDANPPDRPRRALGLDALVAATLILYPFYLDPVSLLPCEPEELIQRLDSEPNRPNALIRARRLQGILRRRLSRIVSEPA